MRREVKAAVVVGAVFFSGYVVGLVRQPPPEHTVEVQTKVVEKIVEVEVQSDLPPELPAACDELTVALDDYAVTISDMTTAASRMQGLTSEAQRLIGDDQGAALVPIIEEMGANIDIMGDSVATEQTKKILWESARDRCTKALEVARF